MRSHTFLCDHDEIQNYSKIVLEIIREKDKNNLIVLVEPTVCLWFPAGKNLSVLNQSGSWRDKNPKNKNTGLIWHRQYCEAIVEPLVGGWVNTKDQKALDNQEGMS